MALTGSSASLLAELTEEKRAALWGLFSAVPARHATAQLQADKDGDGAIGIEELFQVLTDKSSLGSGNAIAITACVP